MLLANLDGFQTEIAISPEVETPRPLIGSSGLVGDGRAYSAVLLTRSGERPMKRSATSAIALVTGLVLAASVALAQTAQPAKVADTAKGKALVDPKGMTLYVFDKDTTGKSACSGACATN